MSRSTQRMRMLGVVLASTTFFAACGGGDDAADVVDAVNDAAQGSSGDGGSAAGGGGNGGDEGAGGDTGSGAAGSGGGLSGGSAPEGEIELGEVYTVEIDPAAAPWSLTIPAGSVTDIEFEAAAENTSSATLSSSDFTISLFAEPGGAAQDVPSIITARDGERTVSLTANGVPGDTISFKVVSAAQPDDPAGGDAPDIITDAIPISGAMTGLLGGEDQTDYFALDVPAGAVMGLEVSVDPTDTFGSVSASLEYNGQNRKSVSAQPGGTEEVTLVTAADEAGEWFVRVNGAGTYTLNVSADPQTDGGGTGDAGDGATTATSVEPGTITGQMGDKDKTDFYDFEFPEGAAISLTLRNDPTSSSNVSARVLTNGKEEVRVSAAAGGTESDSIALTSDQSGTAVLEVWGGASTYEIDLGVGQQEDGGTTGDAGGDEGSAKRIDDPSSPWSGQMSSDDKADFYVLTIDELGPINLTLDVDPAADSGFSARILINGKEEARTSAAPGGSGSIDEFVIEATGDIVIELWNGRGIYTLTVEPAA